MSDSAPEAVLRHIAQLLKARGEPFALVGGLAVSVRAEPRFTRDVDLAIVADQDSKVERLVLDLRASGYVSVAVVEQTERRRLATVRMASVSGVVVDLLAASSGIEREIVERATLVPFPDIGDLSVARAEELLAMKVLSMTNRRLQDRIDALNLIAFCEHLDLDAVREKLRPITVRGYHRDQDLLEKLSDVLRAAQED